MVSRPRDALLDLEYDVIEAVIALRSEGADAYGFGIARRLAGDDADSGLIGHGTLYKALGRMTSGGLLQARWEEADDPGRPRRRLYEVTAEGSRALARRPTRAATVHRTALA